MIALTIDIETTGFLEFDETTHLLRDDCELLEFSYIRHDYDPARKTSTFIDSGNIYFYKDYYVLNNKADEYHKLTKEFLEPYKKDFEMNMLKMTAILSSAVIIGKNSKAFDIPFIENFLNKHAKGSLDFAVAFNAAKVPPMSFQKYMGHIDIQRVLYQDFQDWYYVEQGNPVKGRKKLGTLEDYIKWLKLQDKADELYATLPNKRAQEYHTGLYDVCCTHVLFLYCLEHQIGGF